MTDEARPPQDDEVALPARVVELLAHPGTWAAPPAFTAAELIALAEGSAPGSPAERPAAMGAAMGIASVPPATGSSAAPALGATAEAASVPPAAAPDASASAPAPAAEGVVIPLRRRWMRPVLAVAAALVLVAALTTGVVATNRERPTATIELAGATGAPAAHGRIQVIERDAGWRLVLDVQGLAPAGPGTYYQGWAIKGDEYVPLGTFHMHKAGQVELWSGVPLRQFRRIEVTSQRVGAGQDPGTVVLAGEM